MEQNEEQAMPDSRTTVSPKSKKVCNDKVTSTLPTKALFQENPFVTGTQSVMPTTQVPVQFEEQSLRQESVVTTSATLQTITHTEQNSTQPNNGILTQTQMTSKEETQNAASPSANNLPQKLLVISQVDNVHPGDNQTITTMTTLIQDKKVTFEILTTPCKHPPVMVLFA